MKLKGYDVLMAIRKAGYKPTHLSLYLYPMKILRPTHDFYDQTVCTAESELPLDRYELDGLRGVNVCLVGKHKDARLRNACKALMKIAASLIVTSDDHDGVDIWMDGAWL